MRNNFSHLISWGCIAIILLQVVILLSFLINIDWLMNIAKTNLRLPIHWSTVQLWQWYTLWGLTVAFMSIGSFALYFLHLAFKKISTGELFNLTNSLNLRMFAILLFAQTVAKPIYFGLVSVFLSLNHPKGEKLLSISLGSQEIIMLGSAMIFWVVSDVLVTGSKLQAENQQFI